MSDNFKLDINIPQENIKSMAKEVIREIVREKINDAMKDIDIKKIINGKLNDIDGRISKTLKNTSEQKVDNLMWKIRGELNKTIRNIVLEEIQKKPLTGNVYLKIDNCNVETDYDNY